MATNGSRAERAASSQFVSSMAALVKAWLSMSVLIEEWLVVTSVVVKVEVLVPASLERRMANIFAGSASRWSP